jgi:hypothetical protein
MVAATLMLVRILFSQLALVSQYHLSCLLFPLLLHWDMIRGLKVEVAWACFLRAASMDMDLCRYVDTVCCIFIITAIITFIISKSLFILIASNDELCDSLGADLGVNECQLLEGSDYYEIFLFFFVF